MRNILYILLFLGLWACQDNEETFDISMPRENLRFRPVAGGAIMYYTLPADPDILSINVRYTGAQGQEIMRSGSFTSDSLVLVGFNEARQGVPARVMLCDRNEVESDPIEVTFDTYDSGPVAFFKDLEVKPSWNGFMLTYKAPEAANGMAHVFYIGKNPKTQEPDTLLLSSFVIQGGADTLTFALKNPAAANDVVIRTEDFRGYMVKQRVWESVEAYIPVKLEFPAFDFEDPNNLSVEYEPYKMGWKYLFDGETKGAINLNHKSDGERNTYLAGPGAVKVPLFILDLREPKRIASLRFYEQLYVMQSFPGSSTALYGSYWRGGSFTDMIPCSVTVLGSNDKTSWKKLNSFEVGKESDFNSRWCIRAFGHDYMAWLLQDQAAIQKADPCYLEINVPATGAKYRYVQVVFNELFTDPWGGSVYGVNTGQYVTLHEVEVYTSKD